MTGVATFVFANTPSGALSEGCILAGFDSTTAEVSGSAYQSQRALALFQALGTTPNDPEMVLGKLPDSRWALLGLAVTGHTCAVEALTPPIPVSGSV